MAALSPLTAAETRFPVLLLPVATSVRPVVLNLPVLFAATLLPRKRQGPGFKH